VTKCRLQAKLHNVLVAYNFPPNIELLYFSKIWLTELWFQRRVDRKTQKIPRPLIWHAQYTNIEHNCVVRKT